MGERKKSFRRIFEPDENLVHAEAPAGLDQVTLCGITDWLQAKGRGYATKKPIDCWHCLQIIRYCQGHQKPRLAVSILSGQGGGK